MKKILYILTLLFIVSCVTIDDADIIFDNENILSEFLEDKTFSEYEVIACAASDNRIPDLINVYFFPEEGARDFRLYQSYADDSKDFSSYEFVPMDSKPFFQGALRVFNIRSTAKWFVAVVERNEKIEISGPIRSKVFSQPTVWSESVTINSESALMPEFSWNVRSEEQNAIFFQVVATQDLNLLSGTYTQENRFQYYNLDNVVLNITQDTPPSLVAGETYVFTLMDVSLDNWVNEVIMTPFIAE